MPEFGERVLLVVFGDICLGNRHLRSAAGEPQKWGWHLNGPCFYYDDAVKYVTHWMPLPAAPDQELKTSESLAKGQE